MQYGLPWTCLLFFVEIMSDKVILDHKKSYLVFRLLTFANKIVNNISTHSFLKDCLTPRAQRYNTRSLRNRNEFDTRRNLEK